MLSVEVGDISKDDIIKLRHGMNPSFDQVFPVLYRGWDSNAARADFNAGNWRNKAGAEQFTGGNQSASNVNQAIEDSFRRLNQEVIKRFGEYKAGHPFRIDEVLSQKAAEAKEQIDPYYDETLSNYLTGVQRKIERGTQDTRDLIAELQADTSSFTRDLQLGLDKTINQAKEGYAGAGLYESGARYRTEGLANVESGNKLSDFTRGQQFRENQLNSGLSRNLEDLASGRQQDVRNIERQRTTDIETRKSQLAKESGQQFVTGFNATLPPELQAANGFDLLSNLGIYS
jgi:hypothetical protein